MKLEPLTVSIAPYPQMKCSIKNKKARMESIHNYLYLMALPLQGYEGVRVNRKLEPLKQFPLPHIHR
jgi:hypothetical protein